MTRRAAREHGPSTRRAATALPTPQTPNNMGEAVQQGHFATHVRTRHLEAEDSRICAVSTRNVESEDVHWSLRLSPECLNYAAVFGLVRLKDVAPPFSALLAKKTRPAAESARASHFRRSHGRLSRWPRPVARHRRASSTRPRGSAAGSQGQLVDVHRRRCALFDCSAGASSRPDGCAAAPEAASAGSASRRCHCREDAAIVSTLLRTRL